MYYKSGESENKLRTIYATNQKNLSTASIGSNFTGSYKKRVYNRCEVQEMRRLNYFSKSSTLIFL